MYNFTGNMWAQSWVTLAPEVKPFKDLPSFDTTESMIKNVRKTPDFWLSEKYYE